MQEPERPPARLMEIDPDVRKFLAGLRSEEMDTLRELIKVPADDIREGFKLSREARAIGRFSRWLILTVISIFVGTVVLYEQVLKAIRFLKGGP